MGGKQSRAKNKSKNAYHSGLHPPGGPQIHSKLSSSQLSEERRKFKTLQCPE